MTGNPWLSILLPVYNVSDYIDECFNSIENQDLDGVEVIFFDDASSDNSWDLLREKAKNCSSFKLLKNSVNQGLSAARNALFEASTGEYIWFVDSDDVLMHDCVRKIKNTIDKYGPDFIIIDFKILRDEVKLKHKLRGESHKKTFEGRENCLMTKNSELLIGLFNTGLLHTWSKITHRKLWSYDLRFPVGRTFEDMATTPILMSRSRNFIYIPCPLIEYRQRPGSILSSMNEKKIADLMWAVSEIGRSMKVNGQIEADVKFSITFFLSKAMVTACRFYAKNNYSDPNVFRQNICQATDVFDKSALISRSELLWQVIKRGWIWRFLRLSYWFFRSARFSSKLSGGVK